MTTLGGFEQMVLLAVLRLDDTAYAVTIRAELGRQTSRAPARGALYTALDRLESKGYLSSRMGSPTAIRGGRPKRFYRVTPTGVRVLKESKGAMLRLWRGLDSVLGKTP